jgi:hypothetical protein
MNKKSIHMNNIYFALKRKKNTFIRAFVAFSAMLVLGMPQTVYAQCINTTSFGSASVGAANITPVSITTCNFATEFATITTTSGGLFTFESSIITDYITITDNNNLVISHGPTPHTAALPITGVYRMHITVDALCLTNTSCRATSVVYSGGIPCIATVAYLSSTFGPTNTTPLVFNTCFFAGEYHTLNVTGAGPYEFFSSVATDYLTLTDDNNVLVAAGFQPLSVNLSAAGTFRLHVHSNALCGTENVCRTLSGVANAPLCGTYTINANAPASATNFISFASLANKLNDLGISCAVTVNVVANSGPYNERFILNQIAGTSSTNTITINGNNNIITASTAVSADRATILLNGTDHLHVNGLDVRALGSAGHAVQLINEADSNSFTGCRFEVLTTSTSTFVNSVILSGSLTSATTGGNSGNYNTFANNHHIGGNFGVGVYGSSATIPVRGNKVLNSVFEDYYTSGVQASNAQDLEVIGCDFSRSTRTTVTSFYGVYLLGTDNAGTRIENNRIHDNSNAVPTSTSLAYPIFIATGTPDATKPIRVINNAIYNINNLGIQYGIYFTASGNNVQVYHNTVSLENPGQVSASAVAGIYHTGVATGVEVRNNIISINDNRTSIKRALWFSNTSPGFTSNNNVFNMASTTGTNHIATRGTTNFTTLANWQAAVGNIYDQNSVAADPVFTSLATGNIRPLNAVADNVGAPLGVLTDLYGVTRSTTTPDAGAAEFTGVGSDIAIGGASLIVSPCYSTNDTLQINISNVIGGLVNFSTTPLTIQYQVSGPRNTAGNFTVSSGSLATGSSLNIRIGGIDLSLPGAYSINAHLNPNAFNTVAANDTLLQTTQVVPSLLEASPANTLISNTSDTVNLIARSPFFAKGDLFFTEICHFRTSAIGAPVGGWPAYLIAGDYVEITGPPNTDLGGITLEQWSATALVFSSTFPFGTVLSPNGTAIIATGELGSSQPSPADFYYHSGNTANLGSTGTQGYILRDGNTIIDAVVYGNISFPAAANVTAADWSGTTPALSSAGNRLEGPYTKTSANWINSGASPQNPNLVNNLVTVPTAPAITGFSWSLDGATVSTNPAVTVGPFTTNGTYKYVASFNSSTCGMVYDTATVEVNIPLPMAQIGFGTTVATNSLYTPIYRFGATSVNRYNRSVTIYESGEMANAGIPINAEIQSIAFEKAVVNGGGTLAGKDVILRVWMNNGTTTAPMVAGTWANLTNGFTQVANIPSVQFDDTTRWVVINLSTPFLYTGGTLEVAFENEINATSPFSTNPFRWIYDPAFGTTRNVGNVSSLATFSAANLSSSTLYSWRPNTRFTYVPGAPPSCPAPTQLAVNNVGATSADLNWTENGTATNWTVVYGPVGFDPNAIPTTIAGWNFNGPSTTTVPGGATSPATAVGAGSASLVGGATATFASGGVNGGSSDSVTTVPTNYAWNVANWPTQGAASKTVGVQFNANTTGQENIVLRYDQRLSNAAPNTWTVQYTADASAANPVWVDHTEYTVTIGGDTWTRGRTISFANVAALNNNPNVAFRILATFAPGTSTYVPANPGSTHATSSTSRFDMVAIEASGPGGGTQVPAGSNPFTLTGLQSNTTYQAYVRANCGPGDVSLWNGPVIFTTQFVCPPNAICETYTLGAISSDFNSSPTPTATSTCPGTMTLNIPAGNEITGVDVVYNMTAQTGAWISEQRSRLISPTANAGENLVNGPSLNSGGTESYSRNGLTFANGATGAVDFQLHAIRTWGGSGCDTIYNYINNGSWRVVAYYGPATSPGFSLVSPPDNATLTVAGAAQTPIAVNWTSAGAGANYTWQAIAPGGSFAAPLVSLPSDNAGADTTLTLTVGAVDNLLASLNVSIGDTATIQWNVRAITGSDTSYANQAFTLRLVRGGVASPILKAAPQFAVAPGTTGASGPTGTAATTFFRIAQIILPTEYAAADINNGDAIRSVSFTFSTNPTASFSGRMKVYLQNSTDASYLKNNIWNDIQTGMTLVFDDTITIAAGTSQIDMPVNQNFVYTGGSMYLAFDWEMIGPAVTSGVIYRANTAVPTSIRRQGNSTAPPATLGGTSNFRLEVLWGVDRPADDLEVLSVFAKGSNVPGFGYPENIEVLVRNNGFLPADKPLTLNITGANTFTATQQVVATSGQTVSLNFSGFSATNNGFNSITASVPVDDVPVNNSKNYIQDVNASRMGYADTTQTGLAAVGFNTGSGLLLTRLSINGRRAVPEVRIRMGDNPASVGNTVFAVVLDSSGAIVGQSAPVVLTAADMNGYKTYQITTPPTFENEFFYVGLAQTPTIAAGYFPIAFQNEAPTRANAFFSALLTGAGIAPVTGFRLMIEAILAAPDTLTPFTLATPPNNTTYSALGGGSVTITWNRTMRSLGGTTPPITYEWMVDLPTGTFSPPLATIPSASGGLDSVLVLTDAQINALLAANSIPPGVPAVAIWTVRATSGNLTRLASMPFTITLIGSAPCADPDSVRVTSSGCTDATVAWNSATGRVGSAIQYGPTGFIFGTGTTIAVSSPAVVSGLTAGTNYDVYVLDSCAGGSASTWVGPVSFTTAPFPTASFTSTQTGASASGVDITFDAAASANATSYSWDFGVAGATGTGVNPTHTYTANGTYTVTLVVTNACGTDSTTRQVTISGISVESFGVGQLQLFPNPSSGLVTLSGLYAATGSHVIEVVDGAGKAVYRTTVTGSINETKLDLSKLAAGTYQVRVASERGVQTLPLVIRK